MRYLGNGQAKNLQKPWSCMSAWIFLFAQFVAAQNNLPTQNVTIRYLGNETQQSTVFVVCLGTTGTKSTDSAF